MTERGETNKRWGRGEEVREAPIAWAPAQSCEMVQG